MQNQPESTQRTDIQGSESLAEAAPEVKKQAGTMTVLLWPAIIVLAIAVIIILVLALR